MSARDSERSLSLLLRALFGERFEPSFASGGSALERSAFSGRSQRLPAPDDERCDELAQARAVHAALHAELSSAPFAPGRLAPVQRALFGVLEDARVEALALGRFPGLYRLFAKFHAELDVQGDSAKELLARLSRVLFDHRHHDPSAWVERARRAFYAADHTTSDACRELASVLGNELGQLRLPFDAAAPSLLPRYRDDHTGLWQVEPLPAAHSPQAAVDARTTAALCGSARDDGGPTPEPELVRRYPEWDYVIGRERAEFCAVRELSEAPTAARELPSTLVRGTRRALCRAHGLRGRRREREGDTLDVKAAVSRAVELARGEAGSARIWRAVARRRARTSTLLLLDLSASLREEQLELLQGVALALSLAAPHGAELGIDGFSSHGRERVRYVRFKRFEEGPKRLAPDRSSRGSTRLGAALRHATELLCARRATRKLLLVVSDGEPADVDVFDERYLVEDARHACRAARSRGVDLLALCLRSELSPAQRRIFHAPGRPGAVTMQRLHELPRHLLRAYSRSTLGSTR